MGTLRIKRIYQAKATSDGKRILIDRIWPRGVSKEKAALTLWAKEIAPTNELRQAFGHLPEKFSWFQQEYCKELQHNPFTEVFSAQIAAWLAAGNVTLVYGAKDEVHNHAVVLQEYLTARLEEPR